jgi:hypothetical protein
VASILNFYYREDGSRQFLKKWWYLSIRLHSISSKRLLFGTSELITLVLTYWVILND